MSSLRIHGYPNVRFKDARESTSTGYRGYMIEFVNGKYELWDLGVMELIGTFKTMAEAKAKVDRLGDAPE